MADGIPYPQAPQYQVPNPLQQMSQMQAMGLRAAETQRAEQAAQQQAITFGAKQALGNIMQKHINPETGDFNHLEAFGDIALHPELAVIMPDITEQMLRIPGIKAEALQKQLDYNTNKLKVDSEILAGALRQAEAGGADMRSIATDMISKRLAAGSIDSKTATMMTPQFIKLAENPTAFRRALNQGAQFGEAAQKSLDNANLGLGQMTAQTEYFDANGVKRRAPAYMVRGALSPQQQELAPQMGGGPQNAGGSMAGSSIETSARQEESPSTPPAASYEGMALERSPQMEQRQSYLTDTKGEHWLRKKEAEAQDTANVSAQFETALHQQADVLKNFEQGPLMDARAWTAEKLEGAGLPKTIVDKLMGAKKNGMDAVSAVQAARKGIYTETIEALKQLPGLSRLAVYELQQAKTAVPTIETKKEAADTIFRNLQNTINIAKRRAELTGNYAQWSVGNASHKRAFNESALESSVRDMLRHEGMLREGPITTKALGER